MAGVITVLDHQLCHPSRVLMLLNSHQHSNLVDPNCVVVVAGGVVVVVVVAEPQQDHYRKRVAVAGVMYNNRCHWLLLLLSRLDCHSRHTIVDRRQRPLKTIVVVVVDYVDVGANELVHIDVVVVVVIANYLQEKTVHH